MRSRLIIMASVLGTALAAPASAKDWGQINCDKAKAPDETTICSSTDLIQRDAQMGLAYGLLRSFLPMGGRSALVDAQKVWLQRRRACGSSTECVRRAYQERMADLEKDLERIASLGPF
jgi:uncharacterized protein